jgi:hypothetical protein
MMISDPLPPRVGVPEELPLPEDEVCWQVGNGNQYVVGIELCHATNRADFEAVWDLGVEWAAWQLSKRGWGVDRDPEEAKKWNNRASRAENTPAEQREPAG